MVQLQFMLEIITCLKLKRDKHAYYIQVKNCYEKLKLFFPIIFL
jgi:hypothetical protein